MENDLKKKKSEKEENKRKDIEEAKQKGKDLYVGINTCTNARNICCDSICNTMRPQTD